MRTKPRAGAEVDKAIGTHLRLARMRKGMSQMQLAAEMDLSFQQIQKYEKGTNRIAGSTAVRLAQILGTSVSALLHGVEEEPTPQLGQAALEAALIVEGLPSHLRAYAVGILRSAVALKEAPAAI